MFEKPELLFLQSLGSKEAMHCSVSLLHCSGTNLVTITAPNCGDASGGWRIVNVDEWVHNGYQTGTTAPWFVPAKLHLDRRSSNGDIADRCVRPTRGRVI